MKIIIIVLLSFIYFTGLAQESEVLIPYRKGNKFGYINQYDQIKIPFKYDDAGIFFGGIAWVKKKNRFGYINTKGKLIIKPKYVYAGNFSSGVVDVKTRSGKNKTIGRTGKDSMHFWCGTWTGNASGFSWDLLSFKKDGKYGIINRKNNDTIVSPKYDSAYLSFDFNGYINVQLNGKWGLLYVNQEAISPKYDLIGQFSHLTPEGSFDTELTWIILNGLKGWVNKKGEEVIKPEYEDFDPYFENGLTRVKLHGKWGYIDEKGRRYFD